MKALSLREPWCWAILHAAKSIENRRWPTSFRCEFLLHSAKGCTRQEFDQAIEWMVVRGFVRDPLDRRTHSLPGIPTIPRFESLVRGAIVGRATITDVLAPSERLVPRRPWHMPEQYGFVLTNVHPIEPIPCKGMLGFWTVPDEILARVAA